MPHIACTICFERLVDPVATPCGHIFCYKCFKSAVIDRSRDAGVGTCPTCRKEFTVATLHPEFVPEKYHRFLHPPVRRVFLDDPEEDEDVRSAAEAERDQARIAELEARVVELEARVVEFEARVAESERSETALRSQNLQHVQMQHALSQRLQAMGDQLSRFGHAPGLPVHPAPRMLTTAPLLPPGAGSGTGGGLPQFATFGSNPYTQPHVLPHPHPHPHSHHQLPHHQLPQRAQPQPGRSLAVAEAQAQAQTAQRQRSGSNYGLTSFLQHYSARPAHMSPRLPELQSQAVAPLPSPQIPGSASARGSSKRRASILDDAEDDEWIREVRRTSPEFFLDMMNAAGDSSHMSSLMSNQPIAGPSNFKRPRFDERPVAGGSGPSSPVS